MNERQPDVILITSPSNVPIYQRNYGLTSSVCIVLSSSFFASDVCAIDGCLAGLTVTFGYTGLGVTYIIVVPLFIYFSLSLKFFLT